jgi:hypothetical protein
MADEQKEIVRYEFQADITDLEAKARRASEMATGIDQKIGRFATPLVRDQAAEAAQSAADQAAFQAWRGRATEEEGQLKRTGSATQELIAHKRQLANAVSLMGQNFGGATGQIIGLVGALGSATPVMLAFLTAAAGLAAIKHEWDDIAEAAQKAAAAQLAANEAVAAGQKAKAGTVATLAGQLESYGMRSPEALAAGEELRQKLRETYGVEPGPATRAAALGAAGGFGLEDTARLATGIAGGAAIGDVGGARRFLATAQQAGYYDSLLQQAQASARDEAGKAERIRAKAPAASGRAGLDPLREAFEGLRAQEGGLAASGLPEVLTFDQFRAASEGNLLETMRALYPDEKQYYDVARREATSLQRAVAPLKGYIQQTRDIAAGRTDFGSTEMLNPPAQPMSARDLTLVGLGFSPEYAGQPGQAVTTVVNNYNEIQNIGVQHCDRQHTGYLKESKFKFSVGEIDIKAPEQGGVEP